MLLHLRIKNFAIIDEVELDLQSGFTVITGETGAGKSILVNALNLVLGGRARTEIVRSGAGSAEVEALFDVSTQPVVRARLEQRELVGDDPSELVIRRVVGARGRGKVIINGRLASVATLGEIVRGLVDISGQHEQQSLLVTENHLEILDAYGQLEGERGLYGEAFDAWHGLERERRKLLASEDEGLQRADYIRFQLEEIDQVAPVAGEEEVLEAERGRLAHAERLRSGAQGAEALLYGDDGSAFDKLGKAVSEVDELASIDATLEPVAECMHAARREIEEAARTLQRYGERVDIDPARLEEVEERLEALRRLCRKHGGTVEELVARGEELRQELGEIDNSDERLQQLAAEVAQAHTKARKTAKALSKKRATAARNLETAVAAELAEMDLAGAVFYPELAQRTGEGKKPAVELGPQGIDTLEFLWSANKGEPPRPLARIASGGELSRLMLAVKTVLCNRDLVSLYVFDEVDTGLGGRAADCIGRKIQTVAKGHQAITVTHLAPIAARADHHLSVSKRTENDRTVSSFVEVTGTSRAEEIARMIDGASITKVTRKAAAEMLARSAAS